MATFSASTWLAAFPLPEAFRFGSPLPLAPAEVLASPAGVDGRPSIGNSGWFGLVLRLAMLNSSLRIRHQAASARRIEPSEIPSDARFVTAVGVAKFCLQVPLLAPDDAPMEHDQHGR